MGSKRFQNTAWRSHWSTHIEAWRRSGLSRTKYCRDHRLNKATFDRWLKQLEGAEAARKATEPLREQRRQRRRRWPYPLCKSKRSIAVQAFWAMHVEALNWSGLCAKHYANAHNLSLVSLRRWRDLFDSGEGEIDWRAYLHPSARPKISSGVSSAAKQEAAKEALTDLGRSDPLRDRRSNWRSFTDEEKLAILREAEQPDVSVAAICRRHDIVTSMVFRWRAQFGFGQKERAKLAAVTVGDGPAGVASTSVVLHDLLQPPAGTTAMQLADGRRVFAPVGSDPDAVLRHVLEQESSR